MYFNPPKSEVKKFPQGDHRLYLYGLVYLGAMPSNVEGWAARHAFLFMFESADLPYEKFGKDEEEKPLGISRRIYGTSSANKFYREELRDGEETPEEKEKGWDSEKIVGRLFEVQVKHQESKSKAGVPYANITKIRRPFITTPEDVKPMYNAPIVFSIITNPKTKEPYKTALEVVSCPNYKGLTKWVQNEVRKTTNFLAFSDAAEYPLDEKK